MDKATDKYDTGARALHWLSALLVIGALVAGWTMTGLPFSPLKVKAFNWHKWVGITVLALTLLRIVWRVTHKPPAPLPMPAWQRKAAHGLHGLLYLLLLAQPLVGWADSSAAGIPVVWFGVWQLPDFVAPDKALAGNLEHLHGLLGFALAVLVALHLLAALKHHFIDRDGTLRRMLPH